MGMLGDRAQYAMVTGRSTLWNKVMLIAVAQHFRSKAQATLAEEFLTVYTA
jgi:hypothetical protein